MRSAVYTVQNCYQNYKLRNRLLLVPVFAFFPRVTCCSHASLESFPGFYKWLAGDRLCVVQNGPDIDRIDRIIRNNGKHIQNADFTLASVGRLIEIKNPLSVLSAFIRGRDRASRLLFIGEGDLRSSLMTQIEEYGLGGHIVLTGLIPREKVFEHLTKADLFISTSRGEGLPFAVLEAMACRCPVILSDIAPHREIAAGTDFIPLIQPDNVAGFAREIKRFRQMSASERAQIGEKCRKLVEEQFSLAAMHKKYEEIYARLVELETLHELRNVFSDLEKQPKQRAGSDALAWRRVLRHASKTTKPTD